MILGDDIQVATVEEALAATESPRCNTLGAKSTYLDARLTASQCYSKLSSEPWYHGYQAAQNNLAKYRAVGIPDTHPDSVAWLATIATYETNAGPIKATCDALQTSAETAEKAWRGLSPCNFTFNPAPEPLPEPPVEVPVVTRDSQANCDAYLNSLQNVSTSLTERQHDLAIARADLMGYQYTLAMLPKRTFASGTERTAAIEHTKYLIRGAEARVAEAFSRFMAQATKFQEVRGTKCLVVPPVQPAQPVSKFLVVGLIAGAVLLLRR